MDYPPIGSVEICRFDKYADLCVIHNRPRINETKYCPIGLAIKKEKEKDGELGVKGKGSPIKKERRSGISDEK